jgi:hypothetical protein
VHNPNPSSFASLPLCVFLRETPRELQEVESALGLVRSNRRKQVASQTRVGGPDILRRHLSDFLKWKDAHVDFDAAVKGVPTRYRGVRPRNLPYSLWQIVEHMRIAQWDILDFCIKPDYRERKWPDDYWPNSAEPPSRRAWTDSILAFRADRRRLIRLVNDRSLDLNEKIPHGQGQSYLREFLLAGDHAAFHAGQLIVVRRLLGIWP